jgi:PKD repeat protein
MVNHTNKEAVMTTKRRTIITAAAAALAILPATAMAIPVDDDDPQLPPNAAPVAKLSISPNPALAGTELVVAQARAAEFGPGILRDGDLVKFDASASTDDSAIVKYEFDLDGNGTYEKSGSADTVSRRYTQAGTYTIKLRVTDDGGKTKVVSKSLIVHRRPSAALAATPNVALIGQSVALTAAGSTDDNGIAKYEFDLDGDGTFETDTGTTQTASTSFTTIGERTLKVRVTDIYGATGTRSASVVVHRAPTASFTANPNPALTDEVVTFDGSGSGDDEPIAKYEWDLDGDGTFDAEGVKAERAYPTVGTVTARLRVTDSHGVQDVVTQSLTVNPRPVDTTAPLVTITPGKAKLRGGKVRLTVSCPVGESRCDGRLDLRSLRGARSAALGGKAFALAGGQKTRITVKLSKANRKQVRKLRRLRAEAVAVATDAAGNSGTVTKKVTIRR